MQETTTQYPKLTLRVLALWLGGVVLLGLLLFVYRHLEVLANHGSESPSASSSPGSTATPASCSRTARC